MSAICGIYYKNTNTNSEEAQAVMSELKKYKFDKSCTYSDQSIFMGCCLNHITPESLNEILPYEDEHSSFVITADAIIDNREELFEHLSISEDKRNISDSLLVLCAYKKWGTSCPEYLVGDFAFAIWDKQKEELFCARDHVGKRVLYYYNANDKFAFSTLINPIFKINEAKRQLNDTYIADFLSITSVSAELVPDITIYEGIMKLPPACAMTIRKSGTNIWQYWEIKKTKEIKFATDKEYVEAFLEIFNEAVKCRLRSIKKIGISLSGGLDSGSVACLAAKELKTKNEKLYSFTQVPMEGYIDYLPKNKLADESAYVREICKKYENIQPHFIASEGKSPITAISSKMEMMEQPYKAFMNSYWGEEIMKAAADMGIGVILDGQSGNATVSWGDFNPYALYLLKSGKISMFLKEINAYAKLHHINNVKLIAGTMLYLLPYGIKKQMKKAKHNRDYQELLSPINPVFYNRMSVKKRFKKYGFDPLFINRSDSLTKRMNMLKPAILSNSGVNYTKNFIVFGVQKRDPTCDKRLIEFCMNLPEDQWVRNGEERRLIRRAMEGIMPDFVRLNTTVRGKQAADWIQRIMPDWEEICQEIATIGECDLEKKYLDIPKIKKYLEKNHELKMNENECEEITLLIRALIFSRFLRGVEIPQYNGSQGVQI